MSDPKLQIYADGSCPRVGGPGGWAFCFVTDGKIRHQMSGAVWEATNNTMELMAVIRGLEYLKTQRYAGERVLVCSDSQYVIRGLDQWAFNWKKNGWRRKDEDGKWVQVANPDLWKRLFVLAHGTFRAEMLWVRGHNGHEYNELCDKMAGEAVGALIDS